MSQVRVWAPQASRVRVAITDPGEPTDASAGTTAATGTASNGLSGLTKDLETAAGGWWGAAVAEAVVRGARDRVAVWNAAAELPRDLLADDADDLADRLFVLRLAGERAVQVDQMEPLRALLKPMLGHRRRILGEYGGRLHFALPEANAVTVLDIDRGNDLHGGGCATGRRYRDDGRCQYVRRVRPT